MELLQSLKRLSEDVDRKVSRLPPSMPKEQPPEVQETKLIAALDCLEGEQQVLTKEMEILKAKLGVNADYDQVVALEKHFIQSKKRNDNLDKLVKSKNKRISCLDKRYSKSKIKQENAPPQQLEV